MIPIVISRSSGPFLEANVVSKLEIICHSFNLYVLSELFSSLWVSCTGSASDWCALWEALWGKFWGRKVWGECPKLNYPQSINLQSCWPWLPRTTVSESALYTKIGSEWNLPTCHARFTDEVRGDIFVFCRSHLGFLTKTCSWGWIIHALITISTHCFIHYRI